MIVIKLLVLTLFVVVGGMHINPANYHPFAPACCRAGLRRFTPARAFPTSRTLVTGVVVALGALLADENEIYDLTNIGTLSAFAIVCVGVLVLRYTDPSRPRPFRVPFVWPVTILGAAACIYTMFGLPGKAWERFGIWLLIGLALYFTYGFKNSTLRRGAPPVPLTLPA